VLDWEDVTPGADTAQLTRWSARTLQQKVKEQVGVGPKWVLARSRLTEVALVLEQDHEVDLAKLAVRLGWYDQAHLTNDLRRMLGETPGQYVAQARR
jgi:AraC-like DNA-binding protein